MIGVWGVLALSAAGGVGAVGRMMLDGAVKARTRLAYPVGTTVINVTGSFLLGLLTALAAAHALPAVWAAILGTGLMGGYTTFSTASVETVRLLRDRRLRAAALNAFGMLAVSLAAAAAGLGLGTLF